jgi:hypothetical protein
MRYSILSKPDLPQGAMRHSLQSHIVYLEKAVQDLRTRLSRPNLSIDELQDIELQLALAEGALAHYRHAFELEASIASPTPPDQPSGNTPGGTDSPENPKPKKKDGLAGRRFRARRTAGRILRVAMQRY